MGYLPKLNRLIQRLIQSINQYYFIAAWQNAGPQFAQIKIQYSTIKKQQC